jgi:hypothetical protein
MTTSGLSEDAPPPRLVRLPPLPVGERVRIIASGQRVNGRVARVTEDDVTIVVAGTERALAVGGISEIAVLRTHAKVGALLVGAAGAFALGYTMQVLTGWEQRRTSDVAFGWMLGGGIGLVIGGLIGAGLGALLPRAERIFVAPAGMLAVGHPTDGPSAPPAVREPFNYVAVLAGWATGGMIGWLGSIALRFFVPLGTPNVGRTTFYLVCTLVLAAVSGAAAATVTLRLVRTRERGHIIGLVGLSAIPFYLRLSGFSAVIPHLDFVTAVRILAPFVAYAAAAFFVLRRATGTRRRAAA